MDLPEAPEAVMRRAHRPLAPLLGLLLVLAAACSAGDQDTAETAAAALDRDAPEMVEPDDGEEGAGLGSAGEDADALPPLPATTAATRGDRLIKEGTVTLEVVVDGFEQAFQRVVATATALGGSVVASSSATADDGGGTSGTVTVRVPVDRYEELLVGVGGAGEVRRRDITTQDVTAEFTDAEARLRHARAQERFYLGLLAEAQGVSDAIAVQQQLEGIQQQLEQLQGRLNLLEDRTSYSTLTVELVEPGASPLLARGERPRFSGYLARAQDAFVMVVGSAVVVAVALAPLLLLAGLGWAGWRAVRRTRPATVVPEP